MEEIETLFRASHSNLLSFAASILKNKEDAQDVVQEVFEQCFQNKKPINLAYLYKSVRNRSLNKIRSHKRFEFALSAFSDFVKYNLSQESSDKISIRTLTERLPLKQREVLILRIKSELKISEISEILDIPEGTVKSRLNKALNFLKSHIKVDFYE